MSRTLALLLAGVTALSLTACDDSSSGAARSTTSSPTVPTLADDQPTTTSSSTSSSTSTLAQVGSMSDAMQARISSVLGTSSQASLIGRVGARQGDSLVNEDATPARRSVRVACGGNGGSVAVTIKPNWKDVVVRTVRCAGREAISTRDVWTGKLGAYVEFDVDNLGNEPVDVGIAAVSPGAPIHPGPS